MTISELITGGSVLSFLGILAKLLVDWWRDRRKDRAADEIAEGSVVPTITERNLSVADAQIVFLEKANALERAGYERRIQALEKDVARITAERDTLLGTVSTMRTQMDEMQRQLSTMKAQLDALPGR